MDEKHYVMLTLELVCGALRREYLVTGARLKATLRTRYAYTKASETTPVADGQSTG